MKKVFCVFLALFIALSFAAFAQEAPFPQLYDPALAQQALLLSESTYSPRLQKTIMAYLGYASVGSWNFERARDDLRHTAAYSIYSRAAEGGRTEVLIVIRGTANETEWALNLDLMPSGDPNLPYAENFYLAAKDILDQQAAFIDGVEKPFFLVTGHSRGAAIANILGALLTDRFGEENVVAYTFATPRTARGEYKQYNNIVNFVNPADIVTFLPLPQWGYQRYGVDVVLPVDDESLYAAAREAYDARDDKTGEFSGSPDDVTSTAAAEEAFYRLLPDYASAATLRHAFAHAGAAEADEAGMTAGEFLTLLFTGALSRSEQCQLLYASADNDFAPLLQILAASGSSTALIGQAHMPATYGAWISAMQTKE